MEEKLKNKKKRAFREKNNKLRAEACNDLASYYNNRKQFENAIKEYEEFAKLYEANNEPNLRMKWAGSQRMIGEMHLSLGNFEKALQYVLKHLAVAQEMGDKMEEIKAQENLGRIFFIQGQNKYNDFKDDEAKNLWLHAKKAFLMSLTLTLNCVPSGISLSHSGMDIQAQILLNLSDVEEHLGNFQLAIDYITKAKDICKLKNNNVVLHNCYTTEANMHCNKRNFSKALYCLNKALELTGKLKNKVSETCETLHLKAEVLCKMSYYHHARKVWKKAWKMNTPDVEYNKTIESCLKVVTKMCKTLDALKSISSTDYNTHLKSYETLGDGACRLKHYIGAVVYYTAMLYYAQKAGKSGRELAPIYVSLYQTYKDMGCCRNALVYCRLEYELIKDLRKEAFVTLYNIAEFLYHTKSYFSVDNACLAAWNAAKKAESKIFEIMASKLWLKFYLKLCPDTGKVNTINIIKEKLRKLGYEDFDNLENTEEELRAVAGCDVDTTNVGDDVDLEELRDESDTDEETEPTGLDTKQDVTGETKLHRECVRGRQRLVLWELVAGHPVNVRDNYGWTPLHEAAMRGRTEIVEVLVAAGADIDVVAGEDITPLYDAALNGHLEVVQLLLDKGANPHIKTKDGKTALHALQEWWSQNKTEISKEKEKYYSYLCDYIKNSNKNIQNLESLLRDEPLLSTSNANSSIRDKSTSNTNSLIRDEPLPSTSKANSPITDEPRPSISNASSSVRDGPLLSTSNSNSPVRDEPLLSTSNAKNLMIDESSRSSAKISDSIRNAVLPSTSEISSIFRDSKIQQMPNSTVYNAYTIDKDNVIVINDTPPDSSDEQPRNNNNYNSLEIEKNKLKLLDFCALFANGKVKIEKPDDDDVDPNRKRNKKRKYNDKSTEKSKKRLVENRSDKLNKNNNIVTQPLNESNKNTKQNKSRKRKNDRDDLSDKRNCCSDSSNENVTPESAGDEFTMNISGPVEDIHANRSSGGVTPSKPKSKFIKTKEAIVESKPKNSNVIDSYVPIATTSRQIDDSSYESTRRPNNSNPANTKKTNKSKPATSTKNYEELVCDDDSSLDSIEFPKVNVKYTKPQVSTEAASDTGVKHENNNKKRKISEPSTDAAKKTLLDTRNISKERHNEVNEPTEETDIHSTQIEKQKEEEMCDNSNDSDCGNDESMYVTAVESGADLSDRPERRDGNSPNACKLQPANEMQPLDVPTATPPTRSPSSPTVKVHFGDEELLITLDEETIEEAVIRDLIEEIRSCYSINGAYQAFNLVTRDGRVLSEDAPLSTVLTSPELIAQFIEDTKLHNSIKNETLHDAPASPHSKCDQRKLPSPPGIHEEDTVILSRLDQDESLKANEGQEETLPSYQSETLTYSPVEDPPATSCDWPQPISLKKIKQDLWTTTQNEDVTPASEQVESPTFTMEYEGTSQSTTLHPKRAEGVETLLPDLLVPMEKSSNIHKNRKASSPKQNNSSHHKQKKTSLPPHHNPSRSKQEKATNIKNCHITSPRPEPEMSSRTEQDQSSYNVSQPSTSHHHTDEPPQLSAHRSDRDTSAQTTSSTNDKPSKQPSREQDKPPRSRHDSSRKSTSSRGSIHGEQATSPHHHQEDATEYISPYFKRDNMCIIPNTPHNSSHRNNDESPQLYSAPPTPNESTQSHLTLPNVESSMLSHGNHDTPSRHNKEKSSHRQNKSRKSTESQDLSHREPAQANSHRPKHNQPSEDTLPRSMPSELIQSTSSTHSSNNESSQQNSSQSTHEESTPDSSQQYNRQRKRLSIILKRQGSESWRTALSSSLTKQKSKHARFNHNNSSQLTSPRSKHVRLRGISSPRFKHKKLRHKYSKPASTHVGRITPSPRLELDQSHTKPRAEGVPPMSPVLGDSASPAKQCFNDRMPPTQTILENGASLTSTLENCVSSTSPIRNDRVSATLEDVATTSPIEDGVSPPIPNIEGSVSPTSQNPENSVPPISPTVENGVSPTFPFVQNGVSPNLEHEPETTLPLLSKLPHQYDEILPGSVRVENGMSPAQPNPEGVMSRSYHRHHEATHPILYSHENLPHPGPSEHASLDVPLLPSTSAPSLIHPAPAYSQRPIKMEYSQSVEPPLSDDLLELLGDVQTTNPLGPPIHSLVAVKWQEILCKGIGREEKEKIENKYLVPYNCHLIQAPALNPEVKDIIRPSLAELDTKLKRHQDRVGSVLSALGSAVTSILSDEGQYNKAKILEPIINACRLLCDMHHEETETRREYIMTGISSDLKESLVNTARDRHLFGDNLRCIKIEPKINLDLLINELSTSTSDANPNPLQEGGEGRSGI